MESFNLILPSAALKPYVRRYWTLDAEPSQAAQRTIPTGCMQLVFHRKSRLLSLADNNFHPVAFLSGQSVCYADLLQTGSVSMVVAEFEPYGARAFFSLPLNEVNGCNVSLADLGDSELAELQRRVYDAESSHRAVALIEQLLLKRLRAFNAYDYGRIQAAVLAVNRNATGGVSQLAQLSCLSSRQLNRVYAAYVGASPKQHMRVVRFQRALYMLQRQPETSFTQLAYDCGFYDQAHLIREFKALSGYTPGEYLAACAPYSDYFSPAF